VAPVVVTGAAGHLGANLVRRLLADGHRVRALVRADTRGIDGLPVDRVAGELLDPASLARAFAGADVVYHLAALISITGAQRGRVEAANVQGVRNVVDACLGAGVRRLVHFSSIHAFTPFPLAEALDERRGPALERGAAAYDRSKALGEREVLAGVARGLDAVIVNPTAVLGPHDYKPSRMGRVLLDLSRGRLPALVGGSFDWVDARDVCGGAVAAAERGRTGERYLLSGTCCPVADLARLVAEITGVPPPRLVLPQWLVLPATPLVALAARLAGTEPLFTRESLAALAACNPRISHAKAAAALGYAPRPLRATLEDTLHWFEAHQSVGRERARG
jgi:dihydroflavonol-4-reductase